ncbi:hypothetical protein CHLRE_02g086326v5 [Chlamydomonas reinhardtii]|uniref:Uncharacterized protein n=1 Tax=Chlamydomonas reinhardtii TaxID=3055 RepID=A0A2K3E0Y9_CHLRE|nr:uncharacterized protein CHLRE_02g086326v5 [Chlamydomonas reinhardtii]PNW86435.1 hypothetical protein CHLRE_02g086326v5 [Chlamydomonas reinhardtii]
MQLRKQRQWQHLSPPLLPALAALRWARACHLPSCLPCCLPPAYIASSVTATALSCTSSSSTARVGACDERRRPCQSHHLAGGGEADVGHRIGVARE